MRLGLPQLQGRVIDKYLMAPQADGMYKKEAGLLLIDCPVTCCDVLNQDECSPSVESTQLLRPISIVLKPQQM